MDSESKMIYILETISKVILEYQKILIERRSDDDEKSIMGTKNDSSSMI